MSGSSSIPHLKTLKRCASVLARGAQLLTTTSLLLAIGFATVFDLGRPAQAQIAVRNQGYIPYSDAPIYYRSDDLSDPVALLQKRLDAGSAHLVHEPDHGYLKSVLKLLDVPADSQALVFSKTSFQYVNISPEHPRALYYNDDVYIGAVHGGDTIEVISFDPMQGAIFYLLDERKVDKPIFQRAELDCTTCHIAPATRGVPGVLLRSVYPTPAGAQSSVAPSFITDQKSPWKERWGGWYVTGAFGEPTMANATIANARPATSTLPQLSPVAQPFDAAAYLAPGSDQVALMVLAHQTQLHNLITLTNYQTRLALHALTKDSGVAAIQISSKDAAPSLLELPEKARNQIKVPAEQLLRYLLFANETPLSGLDAKKVIASSEFARGFSTRGVRDSQQRSLRDFDLHERIFRYPCSYLIYNPAFDALPEPAKGYVYHRLLEILTGQDQSADFSHLSAEDRQAILSILLETKPDLPAEWQDYARSNRLRLAALPAGTGRNSSQHQSEVR